MFFVYVLKSLRNGKRYVGYTAKDPLMRLKEHNAGSNVYTRHNRPLALCHAERYDTKIEAMKRERFLKSGQGRKFLNALLGR